VPIPHPNMHSGAPNAIAVRVLLVSDDPEAVRLLSDTIRRFSIELEITADLEIASKHLSRKKYEAVILDFERHSHALALLEKQRATTSNKSAVTLGIVRNDQAASAAFRAGVDFVFVRPLSSEILERTLKPSYSLMLREKRRYYRMELEVPVIVSTVDGAQLATSVNISDGGIALTTAGYLQVGETYQMQLKLPRNAKNLMLAGEVCWRDNTGRVGLQFVNVPSDAKMQLQSWIADSLERLVQQSQDERSD